MKRPNYLSYGIGVAVIAAVAMSGVRAFAQDPNSAPNSYRLDDSWSAKLPEGRKFGQVIALEPDRDGLILSAGERRALFLPSVWRQCPPIASDLANASRPARRSGALRIPWGAPRISAHSVRS